MYFKIWYFYSCKYKKKYMFYKTSSWNFMGITKGMVYSTNSTMKDLVLAVIEAETWPSAVQLKRKA